MNNKEKILNGRTYFQMFLERFQKNAQKKVNVYFVRERIAIKNQYNLLSLLSRKYTYVERWIEGGR